MTPQIQFKGFAARSGLRAWLEAGVRDLQTLTVITAADVHLERRAGASPAMQAYVHLAVSGPDIHATASDHTIQTVWLKILKNLKRQIVQRKAKLQDRNKEEQLVHGRQNRGAVTTARSRG